MVQFARGAFVQCLAAENGLNRGALGIVQETTANIFIARRPDWEDGGRNYNGTFRHSSWGYAEPQYSVGDFVKTAPGDAAPALPQDMVFRVGLIEPDHNRHGAYLVTLNGIGGRYAPGRFIRCDQNGNPLPANPHPIVRPRGVAEQILDPNAPIIPPGQPQQIETKMYRFGPDRLMCKITKDKSFPGQRVRIDIESQYAGLEECAALSVFFSSMAESLRP